MQAGAFPGTNRENHDQNEERSKNDPHPEMNIFAPHPKIHHPDAVCQRDSDKTQNQNQELTEESVNNTAILKKNLPSHSDANSVHAQVYEQNFADHIVSLEDLVSIIADPFQTFFMLATKSTIWLEKKMFINIRNLTLTTKQRQPYDSPC